LNTNNKKNSITEKAVDILIIVIISAAIAFDHQSNWIPIGLKV
jgi:hypothetical protein